MIFILIQSNLQVDDSLSSQFTGIVEQQNLILYADDSDDAVRSPEADFDDAVQSHEENLLAIFNTSMFDICELRERTIAYDEVFLLSHFILFF